MAPARRLDWPEASRSRFVNRLLHSRDPGVPTRRYDHHMQTIPDPQLKLSTDDPPEHDHLPPASPPGPAKLLGSRDIRAARLEAIKADIDENAVRTALSIGDVAARHGVSVRRIRRLFEGTGTTFSAYIREQRLLAARRMLTDPQYDQRAIGAIAFDVGFGDLSYFNRVFRQRFGATPSEIRAAAREEPE
ncbi:MAG: helix-turn-helix transcriptional regulator [Xanthobacteraceae bacterium]|nr:helix-turn-helix transcriptional regulator [Xanthobacteraceae bacterium]